MSEQLKNIWKNVTEFWGKLNKKKRTLIKGVGLRDLRKQEFLTDSLQAEARSKDCTERIKPLVQSLLIAAANLKKCSS